jgi:uncharacterized protein YndB with AHSA1/START domain
MATVSLDMSAFPQQVWAALADPDTYADWVVGSDSIRTADDEWPATGSKFHHRVGSGPLKVRDHTEVLESTPPRHLVLHARARPIGTARVELTIAERSGGSRVTMRETAGDRLTLLALNPLTYPLMNRRNTTALKRLKRIAEATPKS